MDIGCRLFAATISIILSFGLDLAVIPAGASATQHKSAIGNEKSQRLQSPSGNTEYPFGQLSIASDGSLYYVDQEFEQIDEVNKSGAHIILSSLHGGATSNGSIEGLGGLFVTNNALWFTASNGLYTASLGGGDLRWVGTAPGAIHLDVLSDRTIFYTTASEIFERSPSGSVSRVAGGNRISFADQGVPQRAIEEVINPDSIASTRGARFYFTNENNLYSVTNGIATMLRPTLHFFNGELAVGPAGAVFGICDWMMCRIDGSSFKQLFKLPEPVRGTFAAPDALAISPSGSFYISYSDQSVPAKAGIVELSPSGKIIAIVSSRTT